MTTKTIMITGAASGIGASIARRFAKEGWRVGLYDLNNEAAQSLAEELGRNCRAGVLDVTDWDSVQAAIADFGSFTRGRLDVFCNNAGLYEDCPLDKADYAYLQTMIRVNTEGVTACAKAAFPLLRDTPGARLINMGSASSIYGTPNVAVYSGTKFYVRGFTEALGLEWQPHDIGVSVIMPAYVQTPMTENAVMSWAGDGSAILTAEEVTEAAWQAAHSNKQYLPLPRSARWQFTLIRMVPLALLKTVTGRVFSARRTIERK